MSRSYKKFPIAKDKDNGGSNKKDKQLANRRIRRNKKLQEQLYSGNMYKKLNQTYDICDYYFTSTFEEYLETHYDILKFWENNEIRDINMERKTEKEIYREWYRQYKGK